MEVVHKHIYLHTDAGENITSHHLRWGGGEITQQCINANKISHLPTHSELPIHAKWNVLVNLQYKWTVSTAIMQRDNVPARNQENSTNTTVDLSFSTASQCTQTTHAKLSCNPSVEKLITETDQNTRLPSAKLQHKRQIYKTTRSGAIMH